MSAALRVVMISNGYAPRIGGAERQVTAVATKLRACGLDIHVITRRYPALAPFEVIDGVPVHRMPVPGLKPLASLVFTISALSLLRHLRPAIIHAHEFFSTATTAMAAKALFGIPFVVTAHASGAIGDVHRLQHKFMGQQRMANLRRNASAFIAISDMINSELAGCGVPPERRRAIPNGVDTDQFAPPPPADKQALRDSLGISGSPVVIFTGRLAPEKRLPNLLSVWPAVRTAHPRAELLIVGAGAEENILKQMAGAGVRFLGAVADVDRFLRAADLFVLPSATEGLSVAMLEAMSTGLACLVTRVGGAPEVIEQGMNGWMIPPEDTQELQDSIIALLNDGTRRAMLGANGRDTVERRYSLRAVAGQLRELYQQIASGT